jgi:hypothetical protein
LRVRKASEATTGNEDLVRKRNVMVSSDSLASFFNFFLHKDSELIIIVRGRVPQLPLSAGSTADSFVQISCLTYSSVLEVDMICCSETPVYSPQLHGVTFQKTEELLSELF